MSPDPLADRVRTGDTVALAEFIELRRPALRAFVERRIGAGLRGKVDPDDVLQELAVKALHDLGRVGMIEDPFAWLCHLAGQCIVDGHRRFAAGKRAARREVPGNTPAGGGSQDLIALLAASMTTPSQAVVRNERERRLQDAIAGLPDEHREALRLRYGEGLSTREVAERLSKTDGATRVLLSRLVQRLQELLGPGDANSQQPEKGV
jgi:RNA polymerase sigma-70 factor (ECF subfamily)